MRYRTPQIIKRNHYRSVTTPEGDTVTQFINPGAADIQINTGHHAVINHPLQAFADIPPYRQHQLIGQFAALKQPQSGAVTVILYRRPGNRGKISEEDTTETPMYVNRGGRLTILQEEQGQLLTLAGEPDGKLRAAGR